MPPGTAAPPTAPSPAAEAALTPAPTAGFAEAPSAGTGGQLSIAPNMMGDLLGARAIILQGISRDLVGRFPGPQVVTGGVMVNAGTGFFTFGDLSRTAAQLGIGDLDPFFQQAARGVPISPAQAETIQGVLNTLAARPGTPFQRVPGLPDRSQAILQSAQGSLFTALAQDSPVQLTRVRVDPATGLFVTDLEYRSTLTGEISEVPISIPSPGSGGVVGRVKMSEENSPLPRDRVVFVYDYFSNTSLSAGGIDVNRFQFGLEKTFLNGRASVEARLPFAGTLHSTVVEGREDWDTELGNVRLAAKYLWVRRPVVQVSSGVGVSLPTSSDVNAFLADGRRLLRIENESVQVEPFVAVNFTPNDRFFAQAWGWVNGDVSGSPLTINEEIFGDVGDDDLRFWDRTFVGADVQLGYWVYRSPYERLSGLAPFAELHWAKAIEATDLLNAARREGIAVTDTGGAEELNLTLGITALFNNRMTVTFGGSAPLLTGNQRTFDGQFGVRVNWYFGRTAREMNPAYFTSGF
jgi:hypothetical protein